MEEFSGLHPREVVRRVSSSLGCSPSSPQVAAYFDENDDLRHLRQHFLMPKVADLPASDLSLVDGGEECIYLCGNSLGLQPKMTRKYLEEELDKWARTGVHGHTDGSRPWAWAENNIEDLMAKVVGAKTSEVALMNGLTVNLHLLMLSFYKPTQSRHKVLLEAKAFPSDHYAVESQIRLRGLNPQHSMLMLSPREGEETLRTADILEAIEKEGDSIAVVMLSGVQYYTGQLFDMASITQAGHQKGCFVGFDCAHAAGNVELKLHDWGVDFACWCSYKYLNSGAGGLAAAFVHEKHQHSIQPAHGAAAWSERLPPVKSAHSAGLPPPGQSGGKLKLPALQMMGPHLLKAAPAVFHPQVFNLTNMQALRRKSVLLTGYLENLIQHYFSEDPAEPRKPHVRIITPSDPQQRGCQLSLAFSVPIRKVFQELERRGVVVSVTRTAAQHLQGGLFCI
uniref:Kynureninase n=1 Tax=Oryzias latipes TaxID=8090 RepID=H2LK44_ORYLA